MERGRAYRRTKQRDRKHKAAHSEIIKHHIDPNDERLIGILARTMKLCSCYMCGNQRKHFGDSYYDKRNK